MVETGDLVGILNPCALTENDLERQMVLYLRSTVVRPFVANGVSFEKIAQVCLNVAIDIVEMQKGRLAAAVMLQAATRRTFTVGNDLDVPSETQPISPPDAIGA